MQILDLSNCLKGSNLLCTLLLLMYFFGKLRFKLKLNSLDSFGLEADRNGAILSPARNLIGCQKRADNL